MLYSLVPLTGTGAGAAAVQALILGLDRSRKHSCGHWGIASPIIGNRLLFSPNNSRREMNDTIFALQTYLALSKSL